MLSGADRPVGTWRFHFKPGKYGFLQLRQRSRLIAFQLSRSRVNHQHAEKNFRICVTFSVRDQAGATSTLQLCATHRDRSLHIISRRNRPFWLLDSAWIQCATGDNWAPGAHGMVVGENGTIKKIPYKTKAYEECSITVACYLCNTFLKTAATGPFRVVLLLRVQKCSGMLIVRRRGASRGRPVKWFA
jgi:hypothetical protein